MADSSDDKETLGPILEGDDLANLHEDDADDSQGLSDEEILREAHEFYDFTEEAETEIRKLALDDLKFIAGEQWPENIQQDRERDGRPCLVINRLPQFVQQVTNDQRQNRPSIKVHPVDDAGDVETAKVIQGIVRHIQYNSNADVARDTAFEGAARCGFGYYRILTAYDNPESFNQEIYIKRIRNPLSVFFDPFSQEPDGSDAKKAMIVEDLSKEDYKAQFPDSKLAKDDDNEWKTIGNDKPMWVGENGARVAEYFYVFYKPAKIHQLSTGESVKDEDLKDRLQAAKNAGLQVSVVQSRETKIPAVMWCKINAVEVLEKTEWPGSYIPIIPVYGNELWVDGKRVLESVVRHGKDSQRMYNYWASAETEAIALAPRTPFIVAEGQIEGYEDQWKTANRKNHAVLPYKPVSSGGTQVPPPQRQTFEPAVQAITSARMIAAEDLKATTGIGHDAQVGAQGNEVSGVAIDSRARQAQTSTFHFTDNLARSIKHEGRILVDLIPKIYDTARAARIIGDDGEQKVVRINEPYQDENGKPVLYSLDCGRYDVTIDTGPSFASRRQEAAASMLELTKANPNLMGIAGDLIVKNMDWPGADEVADRLRMMLPPQLQSTANKGMQVPPQVQAQMQQMSAMIQQQAQHLNKMSQIIEQKTIDAQMLEMELQHKERMELLKRETDIAMLEAKLGTQGSIELLRQETAAITQRLNMTGMNQPMSASAELASDESSAPNPVGAQGAVADQGAPQPTGGPSPGTPTGG